MHLCPQTWNSSLFVVAGTSHISATSHTCILGTAAKPFAPEAEREREEGGSVTSWWYQYLQAYGGGS